MEIKGVNLLLRPLRLSDAESLLRITKDKEVLEWLLLPSKLTINDIIKLIKKSKTSFKAGLYYDFAITYSGVIIGLISLKNVNHRVNNCELAYWIIKPYRGKGLASEAINLMLKFAFNKLRLNRVTAYVLAGNAASSLLLIKAGFKLEGLMRQSERKNGKYYDEQVFSILRRDFK